MKRGKLRKRCCDVESPETGRSGPASAEVRRPDGTGDSETCSRRREWYREGLIFAALVVITLAVFLPNLGHDFVDWDDRDNFLLNEHYRGLGATQLEWMWTAFHMGHYIPLTWMTLGLDYCLSGMNPRGYHLTNNILHSLNVGLFFLLTVRLLAVGASKERRTSWNLLLAAGLGGLLFAIHPLRVESVSWITERRDLLSGFFTPLTVLAYLRYAGSSGPGRIVWYAAALLLFVAACFSKVMAVSIPAILLVLDWHPLGRLHRPTGRTAVLVVLEKIPLLIGALIFGVVATFGAQEKFLWSLRDHPLTHRIVQSFYGMAFYIWKTVLPLDLSPIYELPRFFNVFEPRFILSVLLVCLMIAAIFRYRRRVRGVVSAGIIYVIVLLPVLGLVQNGTQIVADRYSYLSCMGWMVLMAWAMHRWLDGARTQRWARPIIAAAVLAIAPCLSYLTWKQCHVWRNTASLWTHAAAVSPNSSIAQNGCGWVLLEEKRYSEAMERFRRAIELQPANVKAHHNIWIALQRQGRTDELSQAYQDSIRIYPNFADAHYNLGLALQNRGDYAAAESSYRTALHWRPDYSETHTNLAVLLANRGETADALQHYQQAVQADGRNLIARCCWARLLHRQGQTGDAVEQVRATLRIDPNHESAKRLLAEWTAGTNP